MQFKALSASRKGIRAFVRELKKVLGLENELYIPIVEIVENVLPEIFEDFTLEIVPENEMGAKHGETFPSKHLMRIREDVYYRAVDGKGRDRMTIAHEVGHLFLHDDASISMCRLAPGEELKPYEDPEWQANCFGGELLASSYLIKGMASYEVSFKCGISFDAAEIQIKHAYE